MYHNLDIVKYTAVLTFYVKNAILFVEHFSYNLTK